MLTELAVSDLGVISHLSLVLGPGMTALTGETGAGKTLVVEAIELLVGGRADPMLVRPGAQEARVEGRFVVDGDEVVLARVVPRDGRSRAYVDGRLATAANLAEWGARAADLHGQHAHQSLLSTATQRAALDRFGAVDLSAWLDARAELARIDGALAALGGDDRARAREIDLLRFQVAELDAAALDDPDEDDRLRDEEELLADASAHRDAAAAAVDAVSGDGGVVEALGVAIGALAGRAPFAAHEARLRNAAAELADVAGDVRALGESIDVDPARIDALRARRQLLRDLQRKYGERTADVMAYAADARARLAELLSHDERAAALDAQRVAAVAAVADAAAAVGRARRRAAPGLAAAAEAHLADLAMASAHLGVDVGDEDPGDAVTFLLAANAGAPLLPLNKVASGGELARAMLALRLVLAGVERDESAEGPEARRLAGSLDARWRPRSPGRSRTSAGGDRDDMGPPTLIFDEVDAGIGGQAATAVGRALAELAKARQVLVVTHLPQVAAFADAHVAVTKHDDGRTTEASVRVLDDAERVVELSRMLSGSPESATAHDHAAELMAAAARARTAR